SGNDLLRGGTLVDTFVFDVGHDADEVEDFAIGEDVLRLSSDLVGGQDSGQAVLTTYADVTAEGVLLDFGRGDRILFSNLQNYNGLAADIEFF
ncbi:hypothetical protein HCZ87_20410, partial [Phaeobacter sp. HF9A]|nr:hypothetical protein [Phaeobacter sp. HF9A]